MGFYKRLPASDDGDAPLLRGNNLIDVLDKDEAVANLGVDAAQYLVEMEAALAQVQAAQVDINEAVDGVNAGLDAKLNKNASNLSDAEIITFRENIEAQEILRTTNLDQLASAAGTPIDYSFATGMTDTIKALVEGFIAGGGAAYPTKILISPGVVQLDKRLPFYNNITYGAAAGTPVLKRGPLLFGGDLALNTVIGGDDGSLADFGVEDCIVDGDRKNDTESFSLIRYKDTANLAKRARFRNLQLKKWSRQHSVISLGGVDGYYLEDSWLEDGGGPLAHPLNHGLYTIRCKRGRVMRNRVDNCLGAAFKLSGAATATTDFDLIMGNHVTGATRGAQISDARGTVAMANFFEGCTTAGITFNPQEGTISRDASFIANIFWALPVAWRVNKSTGVTVRDGLVYNCTEGFRGRNVSQATIASIFRQTSDQTTSFYQVRIYDIGSPSDIDIDQSKFIGAGSGTERVALLNGTLTNGAVTWGRNSIRGDDGAEYTSRILIGRIGYVSPAIAAGATSVVLTDATGIQIGTVITFELEFEDEKSVFESRTVTSIGPVTWSGGLTNAYPLNAPVTWNSAVNAAQIDGYAYDNNTTIPYTVATLPDPAKVPLGAQRWATDLSGTGAGMVRSIGTAWRPSIDTVVSRTRAIVDELNVPMNRLPGMERVVVATRGALGAAPTGTARYQGGVLAPNGKIYSCPYDNAQGIHIIDTTVSPATASVSLMGLASITGATKWQGGVYAPNGLIYFMPYDYTAGILIVNPVTGVAVISMMGLAAGALDDVAKWKGACLGRDGKVYGIPFTANDMLIIDPAGTATAYGTATRSNMGLTMSGTGKFHGGVVGPNGRIFGIPYGSGTILVIDTEAGTATFSTMGASIAGSAKWQGGALGPDGCIYGIPANAIDILKIDPILMKATRPTLGATLPGAGAWRGGVLGPDGRIYGMPYNATTFLVIDAHNGVATTPTLGAISLVDAAKWSGGVLAPDGNIYGVPSGTVDVLTIGKFNDNFPSGMLRGAYMNFL